MKAPELTVEHTKLQMRLEKFEDLFENQLQRLNEIVQETKSIASESVQQQHESGKRLAAFEERIKTLEKHTDRTWQVWLALAAAITALLVAFLKK